MKCNVGWLVSQIPNDGRYVPFFVKVRSKDIVWYDLPSEEVLSVLNENEMDEYQILYPNTSLKFIRDGWHIKLNYDFTFEINKKFYIDSSFVLDKTRKELCLKDVELPFLTSYDKDFSISATKVIKNASTNTSVKYANCAIQMDNVDVVAVTKPHEFNGLVTTEIDNYNISDTIDICLYNPYKFDENELVDENIFIDVTIKGEVFTLEEGVESELFTNFINEDFTDLCERFTNTFYEQFGHVNPGAQTDFYINDFTDVSKYEDIMYANIGGNFNSIDRIIVDKTNTVMETDETKIYIGNGTNYLRTSFWKLNEKNELLISLPFLVNAAILNNGKSALISINGFDFEIQLFENVTEYIDLEPRFKNSVISLTW